MTDTDREWFENGNPYAASVMKTANKMAQDVQSDDPSQWLFAANAMLALAYEIARMNNALVDGLVNRD